LVVQHNCEHLIDACAEFATVLLAACPQVTVLATSRQSLAIPGEQVLPIGPLAVPGGDRAQPLGELISFDAVSLFVDRACAVWPRFRLTAENQADVVRLCRQLDGLPLAIELAAARVRALSPGQIADRLSLSLLT